MRTPEEIKKALSICSTPGGDCRLCPYEQDCLWREGSRELIRDAAELIDMLEGKQEEPVGAWERLDCRGSLCRSFRCPKCGGVVDPGCYTHLCDYEYCPYCGKKLED